MEPKQIAYPTDYPQWILNAVAELRTLVWDASGGTLNLSAPSQNQEPEIAEIIRKRFAECQR